MARHNIWMSVSDLMTALMVIFLFIAIAYIQLFTQNAADITAFADARTHLHDKLTNKFAADTARWQMTIGTDLSIRFTNVDVLFPSGSYELTPDFCEILDEFLPQYFEILLTDSLRNSISEVRIEGHTDPSATNLNGMDPYMFNLVLSQRRANSVLNYYRHSSSFLALPEADKRLLEFWFTANGLSYGHTLNSSGELTLLSDDSRPDYDRSRRVEIRIITTSEKMLDDFVEKLEVSNNYRID